MKKKLIFLLIISNVISFVGGSFNGRRVTISTFSEGYESANAHVLLSHYTSYRDIAISIANKDYEAAACGSELLATAMFDGLGTCLENKACRENIEAKVLENAPEVFGRSPVPIKFRKTCPQQTKVQP